MSLPIIISDIVIAQASIFIVLAVAGAELFRWPGVHITELRFCSNFYFFLNLYITFNLTVFWAISCCNVSLGAAKA